jgi:murein DD-endopeptidase MepM/ murein hydrolase activator NlpD
MAIGDRLKTIVATAIVTSIAWLTLGTGVIDGVGNLAVLRKAQTADRAGPAARETGKPLHDTPVRVPAAAAAGQGYLIPVAGVRPEQLTDTFTQARDGGARVHDAIDIMAPRGTPVLAAASGTLEKLFTSKPGGLTIYVRSPDRRTITYYAHLDAYAPGLREGMQVHAGQPLGTVGFSGNADPAAPHLHFAIMQTTPDANWWDPATAINPYPLLAGRRR